MARKASAAAGPFRSGPPERPASGPPPLPGGGLRALGCDAAVVGWEHRWVKRGSDVWRLDSTEGPRWLKVAWAGGDSLAGERDRLAWLAGQLGSGRDLPRVPEVVGYVAQPDGPPGGPVEWLLTTDVDGVPASDPRLRMASIEPLIRGIGRGLRRWHDALSVTDCPFDHRSTRLLRSARTRLEAGGIRADAGGPAYDRLSAADKVAYAEQVQPDEPSDQLVVAHGDAGLPNLLIAPDTGELVGLVDLGRLGVSDPHRDLAVLVRSFVATFGGEHAWRLIDAYGEPPWRADPQRLEFHALLDDLW